MPSIDFEFRARGAAAVRRDLDSIRASAQRTGQAVAALSQGETRTLLNEIGKRQRARSKEAGDARANEARITSAAKDGARDRTRASEGEADARAKAYAGIVKSTETTERQRTQIVDREARRRAALEAREARERQNAVNRANNNRQRVAQQGNREASDQGRADDRFNRSVVNNGRAVLQWGRRGVEFVGQQGDAVRSNIERARGLEDIATGISIDSTGDGSIARDVLAAAQREYERTGIRAEDILAALGEAQSRDSVLADPTRRANYLANVLPQLLNASGASGASLTDTVVAAIEYQRQHGTTDAELPRRLAAGIAQTRGGSIGFVDFASHSGVLGGAASRFLANSGAGGEVAANLTGALFETAGKAGGSGDEAATRARAFLDNFASSRGQRRLTGALGRNVLDATGQLRTNAGENQGDAFFRLIEEAYRRTGGNSDRFLTAVAGTNTRARSLGDQLFTDMRRNAGHLVATRALFNAGNGARPDQTDAGAAAAFGTSGAIARQGEARQFYDSIAGASVAGAPGRRQGNAAEETLRMIEALRAESPWAASLVDTGIGHGVLDLFNQGRLNADNANSLPASGIAKTRRQQIHNEAMRQAAQNLDAAQDDWGPLGSIVAAFRPQSTRNDELQRETARLEQIALGRERTAGRNPDAPLALAPESISQLASQLGAVINAGKSAPQAAAQAAGVARTEAAARGNRT